VSAASDIAPGLSVVVALKCARTEDPLDGIRAWSQEQTCERHRLEVVVASNGDHPDWEKRLPEVLTPFDRHVRPKQRVGTCGLLDAGARVARGKWIYLCELHTIPDPSCGEELLAYLDAHDLAGAVAESGTLGEGPLAAAEARYYQEVVGAHLGGDVTIVTARGMAIRKDVLVKVGGVPTDYSIFYERVLQGHLRELGARVGHARRAHFVHSEQTTLNGHRKDIALFTTGEHRYRSEHDAGFCDRHLGRPEEWAERHAYRRDLAWMRARTLAASGQRALRDGRVRLLPGLGREWLREAGRALFGAWGEIGAARFGTALAELRFRLAWSEERRYAAVVEIKRRFTRCVRLWWVGRDARRTELPELPERSTWGVTEIGDDELVGFHATERHGAVRFRWTTPAAAVRLVIEPGDYEVRIATGGLRPDLAEQALAVRFDSALVPAPDLRLVDGEIRFPIERTDFTQGPEHRLCLACAPVCRPIGCGESRRLGLPVRSIEFARRP